MKTYIKYKVLCTKFYIGSAVAAGQARIKYKKGEWVTSLEWLRDAGYYPFVFDTFSNAYEFRKTYGDAIFKVRVKGRHRIKTLPHKIAPSALGRGEIRTYSWNLKEHHPFPLGTEMWEYIKLLEEV